jgi:drug/metabolite transporter (DMT)-like permease
VAAALFALGASVAWGTADFLGGTKSRRLPVLTVMALAQLAGLAFVGVVVAIRGQGPPGAAVLWASLAAICGTTGLAAFYRGMVVGAMSIVAPIAATSAAIPVAIGLATGDRPSHLQELGFVVALGGVVFASREPRREGRARIAAGVGWALAATLGFGLYFVPMHAASAHDPLWAAFVFRATATIWIVGAWLVVRPSFGVRPADLRPLVAIGILDTGGNIFYAAASARGLVSVVSVLAALYPVTTVALARFYLRERVGLVQQLGVAATLAGVVLISAG